MIRALTETETQVETEKKTLTEDQMLSSVEEVEKQTEAETEVETEVEKEETEPQEEYQTEYLKSFSNATLGDMIHKDDDKKQKELEKEKEALIKEQYEEEKEEKIIEKPNFDLIETNKKVLKFRQKTQKTVLAEKKKSKKLKIALSVGLAISAILCVTNVTILDNYSAHLSELETEFYEVNLPNYLKNIANLDTTKKSMEFLDTYPEEVNNAGDLGEKTNWFDKFSNFISGLFGG